MSFADCKQLVGESSGSVEEHTKHTKSNNILEKMASNTKLVWSFLFFCLCLIAWTHCLPDDVTYSGDDCNCLTGLDFSVNVPTVPKQKKHVAKEYGYEIEVPSPTKAKVSYSFDFIVEEPRAQKRSVQPIKSDLFTTIRHLGIKKGDYKKVHGSPSAAHHLPTCSCGECTDAIKPLYRYVWNNIAPAPLLAPPPHGHCTCQRPNCKCNLGRALTSTQYSPNTIFMGPNLSDVVRIESVVPLVATTVNNDEIKDDAYVNNGLVGAGADAEVETVKVRRKRDLQRQLFRPHQLNKQRENRYVKLYHRNLFEKPQSRLLDLDSLLKGRQQTLRRQLNNRPMSPKTRRKAKKTPYIQQQRARLVKRDIKGEYDLLEKEREQMDLTLPEIIQFMPETLQPDFKKGQCYFDCGLQRVSEPETADQTASQQSESTESTSIQPKLTEIMSIDNSNPSIPQRTSSIMYTEIDTRTGTDKQISTATDYYMDRNHTEVTPNNADSERLESFSNNEDNFNIEDAQKNNSKDTYFEEVDISSPNNVINLLYTKKRNAGTYHINGATTSSSSSSKAESSHNKCTACTKCSSALLKKRADNAYFTPTAAPQIPTNPNYSKTQYRTSQATETAYSATPHYCNDGMSGDDLLKNTNTNTHSHLTGTMSKSELYNNPYKHHAQSQSPRSTPNYSESPIPPRRYPLDFVSPLEDQKYSVDFIDAARLDKLIADIVYSHPEFIEAAAHPGGALVDPPAWQEQEVIDFAKHLIDDRLSLWFGRGIDYSLPHYHPAYHGHPLELYPHPPRSF